MLEQWAVDLKRQRALSSFEVGGRRGVEIGPLDRPMVRREASEVFYVDHLPTAELRRKYAGDPNVVVDNIPPVDFVWNDQPLKRLLGDKAPLDYIVAAHVVEHVPDLVGWLLEMAELLRVGGRLILVVPDKRFTFDAKRQTSTIDDVLAAWREQRRRPSLKAVKDHSINVVNADCYALWADYSQVEHLQHYHGPEFLERVERRYAEGAYIDVHCWVFTPWSLFELLAQVARNIDLPFDLGHFLTTQTNDLEFYLQLVKTDRPSSNWAEVAAEARRTALHPNNWPHSGPQPAATPEGDLRPPTQPEPRWLKLLRWCKTRWWDASK